MQFKFHWDRVSGNKKLIHKVCGGEIFCTYDTGGNQYLVCNNPNCSENFRFDNFGDIEMQTRQPRPIRVEEHVRVYH